MIKAVAGALVPIIIVGILLFVFGPKLSNRASVPSGPVTIKYFGFEDESVILPILQEFEKNNPGIKVNYNRQSNINYRTRVQTQIREGVGPDIFTIHASWTKMFSGDLAAAPGDVLSLTDFQNTFFPVAAESFLDNNRIFGVPNEIDGLALYYNEEILTGAGVQVPKTWQEFIDAATKVTVKDSTGVIKTAGAALGTASNVDFWPDILGLLLLQQPGVSPAEPVSPQVTDVLKFYTGFVTDPARKTWDTTLLPSTTMFAQGTLAFYFAPSAEAPRLSATNPNLKFRIASVPQLPGRNVAWGSFWGNAVSVKSKHKNESWKLAKFLAEKEQEKQKIKSADPLLSVFVSQGPIYKSWYLSSGTKDLGINDEMIKVWEEAVNAILSGTPPQSALQNIDPKVKKILETYTVLPTSTPRK
ncbi:MAG: Uncharacterized protein G01um101493_73 [Microgenomates group bacterium Gr01-1014_93]|nr:MAG: Uncharacterized protein G01um101493_73 [Microgenomates group bacterium Gr01-1014_93]